MAVRRSAWAWGGVAGGYGGLADGVSKREQLVRRPYAGPGVLPAHGQLVNTGIDAGVLGVVDEQVWACTGPADDAVPGEALDSAGGARDDHVAA